MTKTHVNGSSAPPTSETSSTWHEFLLHHPDFESQFDEGMQLARSGRPRDAARILSELVEQYPDQAPLLWYLGGIYMHDLHQLKKAIPLFRESVSLSPKSERASLALFHALWKSGQEKEALQEIKRFQTLTDWSCQEYLDIVAELHEKWLDDAPKKTRSKN